MSKRFLYLLLTLSPLLLFSLSPLHLSPSVPHTPTTLTYVESSSGLGTPQLEGGRTELEFGDVNADGNVDIVSIGDHGSPYVNTQEHGIMVWFGDGLGNWSVYQNGEFGYGGLALGDVNGDGLLDIGYGMHHNYSGVDFGDQILEVALGDGTGQNWTPWDNGLASNGEDWGMFHNDFADVDNDGDLDLGSISFGCCAGVHVYLNQGDGSWVQSFGFLNGNSEMQFDFGDVNGDGNADFAVSHSAGTVYFGNGAGGFSPASGNLPAPILDGLALGDVDGDGRDDLSFCTSGHGVAVWKWISPNVWQSLSTGLPTSGTCAATQIADMDMDGHRDVAAYYENRFVHMWSGDGAGTWTETASFQINVAVGYHSAFRAGADADHNGYPDLAVSADNGGTFTEHNKLLFYKESSTPTALEIKPVYPSGFETLRAGGIAFVDWISAIPLFVSGGGEAALELSVEGPNGPWLSIASGLPDNGRYQWHISPDTPSTSSAYLRYTLTLSDTVSAITPAPFTILGAPEIPISGLGLTSDSPTSLGEPTTLTITLAAGTNVTYSLNLGDTSPLLLGNLIPNVPLSLTHTYPATGLYTPTLTAANTIGSATVAAQVSITPPVGDTTPPEVIAVSPGDGAVNVSLTAPVIITFTESISLSTFLLTPFPDPGGWTVTGQLSNTVILLTHTPFTYTTPYAQTIIVSDLAGNPLPTPYTWTFTTEPAPVIPPTYEVFLPVALAGKP
ncbi:MAG TPA: FG-GAP-like repeat-containing protein [Anaerolineales bacterium]|nr:FG-GAP-like repeat-containing protein [Anaerolineales bacterium]